MKIRRLKLASITLASIKAKEMDAIIGGATDCTCSCYYQNLGGSSTGDNKMANYAYGYSSTKSDSCVIYGYNSEHGDEPVVFPKEN